MVKISCIILLVFKRFARSQRLMNSQQTCLQINLTLTYMLYFSLVVGLIYLIFQWQNNKISKNLSQFSKLFWNFIEKIDCFFKEIVNRNFVLNFVQFSKFCIKVHDFFGFLGAENTEPPIIACYILKLISCESSREGRLSN